MGTNHFCVSAWIVPKQHVKLEGIVDDSPIQPNNYVKMGAIYNDSPVQPNNHVKLVARTTVDDLYHVQFGNDEVETIVTNDPTRVDSWITNTLIRNECRIHRLMVGLDTEWTPEFMKGCDHSVAILQLCVGRSCLIYQILNSPRIPQKLRAFLENPGYTFVGVGIKNDADKLRKDYGLRVSNIMDIGLWAAEELGKKELRGAGLKVLAKQVVGKDIGKKPRSIACSRWDNRLLTEEQVAYACGDGYYSFEIGRRLSAWY